MRGLIDGFSRSLIDGFSRSLLESLAGFRLLAGFTGGSRSEADGIHIVANRVL
jgi:hypothetical protein